MSFFKQFFTIKNIEDLQAQAANDHSFQRHLNAWDLTLLGIGCIVGTGIFVLTGEAAAHSAGPAVSLSFVLGGLVACFAALCYAEMASMLPVSGSAYTYVYATMGELMAWLLGWDLILEYMVGAATVAVGWSSYMKAFLDQFTSMNLPQVYSEAPWRWNEAEQTFVATGAYINLPAMLIILLVCGVLVLGSKGSALFNRIMVSVKLLVIALFLIFSMGFIRLENWQPFIPENTGRFGEFGWSGVFKGATMVFFSFVGFDAVSTAAQETKDPQKNVPIGIMASLTVCTILYVLVALVLTGVVSYHELGVSDPVAKAIRVVGQPWLTLVVELGAILGLTSVLLVLLMAQPRVFYTMSKDGLFPKLAQIMHPVYGTPYVMTFVCGSLCAFIAGFFPIGILGELCSVGTLLVFMMVSLGIPILRYKRPDLNRSFQVPFGPWLIPGLSVLSILSLILSGTSHTLLRLAAWMAIGLVVYFFYGFHYSSLKKTSR